MPWRAAAAGDDIAMLYLGGVYYYGRGVGQDCSKARDWYRKSAEAGNADGMFSYGYMLYSGEGGSTDYAEAYKWLQQAANLGQEDALDLLQKAQKTTG